MNSSYYSTLKCVIRKTPVDPAQWWVLLSGILHNQHAAAHIVKAVVTDTP